MDSDLHIPQRPTRQALAQLSKDELIEIVLHLVARVEELERRLGMNSRNSSMPPSTDPPQAPRPEHKPTGRRPGGQPGHEGHCRPMLPVEDIDEVIPVKPPVCDTCGAPLRGEDKRPRRHQVWELPPITPHVTEYQIHTLQCPRCGGATTASWPAGVPTGGFGPRLTATVALLTGVYHTSKRTAQAIMADLFGTPMGLGSVTAAESAVSDALAQPVQEARAAVESAHVLHADETGWREARHRAWLWVAVTSVATVFLIHASRGQQAARHLLGAFAGVLVSDRWGGYNFYGGPRQLCWAHLRRAFTAFSEYGGQAGRIGEDLLAKTRLMFTWWHRVRDGTLSRQAFQDKMQPVRSEVEGFLREGTTCGHKKMQRQCKNILKLAPALWTFVDLEGVEPTNNAAERAVRPGVLWRKGSFGTQSPEGSRFVERIMTACATCKQHGRNVVEYLGEACQAALHGDPAPSLIAEHQSLLSLTA